MEPCSCLSSATIDQQETHLLPIAVAPTIHLQPLLPGMLMHPAPSHPPTPPPPPSRHPALPDGQAAGGVPCQLPVPAAVWRRGVPADWAQPQAPAVSVCVCVWMGVGAGGSGSGGGRGWKGWKRAGEQEACWALWEKSSWVKAGRMSAIRVDATCDSLHCTHPSLPSPQALPTACALICLLPLVCPSVVAPYPSPIVPRHVAPLAPPPHLPAAVPVPSLYTHTTHTPFPPPPSFLRFMGILTLESFTSAALGLAVGALAPNTESAVAIGPAIMLVWIVFGGYYANAANIPK